MRLKSKPKAKPLGWKVVEKSRNVHEFRAIGPVRAGWEGWILWMSDEHWDHPKCNRELIAEHHNEAARRGAAIVKIGDTYCAMQGTGDPRGDKGSVREEHWGGDYLDLLVSTAAKWYSQWRDYIAVVSLGNHETSVYRHHETCLVTRLCQSLQDRGGIARKGGYSGFIRCMFQARDSHRSSFRSYYNHGFGGGGPVTKGKIDFNRMAEYIEADALISGHVHYKMLVPVRRVVLTDSSQIVSRDMQYVRLGTYKDEYDDGNAGFHIEKGRGPRPLGGYWQRFSVKNDQIVSEWFEAK